jgi:hypothetical protein
MKMDNALLLYSILFGIAHRHGDHCQRALELLLLAPTCLLLYSILFGLAHHHGDHCQRALELLLLLAPLLCCRRS